MESPVVDKLMNEQSTLISQQLSVMNDEVSVKNYFSI